MDKAHQSKRFFKRIVFISLLLFVFACGSKDKEETNTNSSIKTSDSPEIVNPKLVTPSDPLSIWIYDSMLDTIVQVSAVNQDTLTSQNIIQRINAKHQNKVKLDFLKTSHDTVFVSIENSTFLTQQMGSTGSQEFLISATFNLTEMRKINYVNFDFEEGDHAVPGTYCREQFLDWISGNKRLNLK